MASVKKYPFYTEMEMKISLQALKEVAINYFLIADIILHTGAELSEVLNITNRQMVEGQTFIIDNNSIRSVSLKKYKDIIRPRVHTKHIIADEQPFFLDSKGSRLKETNIRAVISRLYSSTGVDASLIRFQKTFFLDYMIKNRSRMALKEVASSGRINEFCNEEWIKDYLGLTDEMFLDIQRGNVEPIIDRDTKYSEEVLTDACKRLEELIKAVEKDASEFAPAGREKQIIIIEDTINRIKRAAGPGFGVKGDRLSGGCYYRNGQKKEGR